MKSFFKFFLLITLSSCATTSIDQREVTPELFDPELKNGKIFVFSNHNDPRMIHVRVNDEYQEMKHKDLKIFELNKGKNSIYSFKKYLEDEFGNCNDEPYTFDTEILKEETYYFLIQYGFMGGNITARCLKDFKVSEEAFLKQINRPRSYESNFFDDLGAEILKEILF